MSAWYSLRNKSVWVTGGAGYLGSAITRELDAECAKVVCLDLPGRADALVREHKLTRTVPLAVDVNDIRFNCVVPGPFPDPNVQKTHPQLITDLAEKTPLRRIEP